MAPIRVRRAGSCTSASIAAARVSGAKSAAIDARAAAEQARHPGHGRGDHGRAGGERLERRDRLALGVRGDDEHVGARDQRAGRPGRAPVKVTSTAQLARRAPRAARAAGRRRRPGSARRATSAAARRKRSGFLTSTSRPTKADGRRPAPRRRGGGRRDAVVDHAARAPNAGSRSSETTTTSSAARASSRAARGAVLLAPRRGGWRAPAGAAGRGRAGPPRRRSRSPSCCARARRAGGRRARTRPRARSIRRPRAASGRARAGRGGARRREFGVERAGGAGDGDVVTARGQPARERHARRARRLRGPCPGSRAGSSRARTLQTRAWRCRPLEQWPARLDRSLSSLSSWPRSSRPSRTPRPAP